MYSAIFMFSLVYLHFKFVLTKTTLVIYDEIRTCDDFCKGDECFDFFDLSRLNIISDEEDETVAYLNGTYVINVPISSPAPALVWTEKRYGTKWATEAFYRRYSDTCTNFINPLDPMYRLYKDQKKCPQDVGDTVTWNMHKISLPVVIPPSFIGEWRLLLAMERKHEGKMRKQCRYIRGDVYEV